VATITTHICVGSDDRVESITTASFTPVANSRLYVCSFAQNQGRTTFSQAIDDSEGLTWSDVPDGSIISTPFDLGTSFNAEARVWFTDIGASPVSMTVTIQAHTDGRTTYHSMSVVSVEDVNPTTPYTQDVVGHSENDGGGSAVVTFGSAPSGHQLIFACSFVEDGSIEWDSPPTDFTLVDEADGSPLNNHVLVIESDTNTTAAVTIGNDGADGDTYHIYGLALDFTVDTVVLALEGYRVGDDGTEAGHGWKATQDAGATVAPGEIAFMRSLLDETGGGDVASAEWVFQVKRDDEPASEWRAT